MQTRVMAAMAVAVAVGSVEVEFAGTKVVIGAGQKMAFGDDERRVKLPVVYGTLKSIDAEVGSLELKRGGDQPGEVKLNLSREAQAFVDGKAVKLADLKPGMLLAVTLDGEGGDAIALRAGDGSAPRSGDGAPRRPQNGIVRMYVGSIDVAARTVSPKTERGEGDALKIAPDARITLDGKPAALADIQPGTPAVGKLSDDGSAIVALSAGRFAGRDLIARDGDRPREGARDGDRPKEGPRDGDRPKEGPRDGERPKGDRPRDGDRPKEGPRDGERPREGDRPKDGERPREGDRPKDGERPREGDRPPVRREERPDFVGYLTSFDFVKRSVIVIVATEQGEREERLTLAPNAVFFLGERVGDLSKGIRVAVRLSPDDKKVATMVRVVPEVRREGERPKDGERRPEGERPKDGERRKEGDRPKDGDRPKEGARDGDRPKEGARDGDRPKEGARDGERKVEGERKRDGEK